MTTLPSLFVSHGAPTMILHDSPARRFLKSYGVQLGKPDAILVISAHWETGGPTVGTTQKPETIYDFFGFPSELYAMAYSAPGAPDLAQMAAVLLDKAGLTVAHDPQRGLDHGAWVPLSLMYEEADIPVTQLSVQPRLGSAHHLAVGRALAPLRDQNVLVVGSGSLTHNLSEFGRYQHDSPAPGWVSEFTDWVHEKLDQGQVDDLLAYREQAPHARANHPSEEHLLPLFCALGAGGGGAQATRVHSSTTHGVLAMDAYAFG